MVPLAQQTLMLPQGASSGACTLSKQTFGNSLLIDRCRQSEDDRIKMVTCLTTVMSVVPKQRETHALQKSVAGDEAWPICNRETSMTHLCHGPPRHQRLRVQLCSGQHVWPPMSVSGVTAWMSTWDCCTSTRPASGGHLVGDWFLIAGQLWYSQGPTSLNSGAGHKQPLCASLLDWKHRNAHGPRPCMITHCGMPASSGWPWWPRAQVLSGANFEELTGKRWRKRGLAEQLRGSRSETDWVPEKRAAGRAASV